MQSRVPLGPGKFHVVVLVKLKGTSPLKENVSQNAIKEPKKKKKRYHSFDIGSYKGVTFRLATRQTRI